MSSLPSRSAPFSHKKCRLQRNMADTEERIQAAVMDWFNKKFQYQRPTNQEWKLPKITSGRDGREGQTWEVPSLLKLKADLNAIKSQLSDKDARMWREHTGTTNPAGAIVGELKRRVEVCTQAWAKFYEVLNCFPIAQPQLGSQFNSVHLCEAPGAFISALNHFLHRDKLPVVWHWLATTLNPYYESNGLGEMIDDARLIQGTLSNWYLGQDDTGNLMSRHNLHGLLDHAGSMKDIQLVTADGSIDCMLNPAEQEAIVSWLHHWEVLTALLLLGQGGSLVIKMFTLLEAPAVCLVYLLNCLFKQVNVFKPATSKGGNSEVYIVCLGFNKNEADAHFHQIEEFVSDSDNSKLPMFDLPDLPASFLEQHEQCQAFFIGHQTRVIENNVRLFQQMSCEETTWLQRLRQECLEHFFRVYRVGSITSECRLQPNRHHSSTDFERVERQPYCWYSDNTGKHSLSHEKREEVAGLPWHRRVLETSLYPDFSKGLDRVVPMFELRSLYPMQGGQRKFWNLTYGKPLSVIHSSRLCQGKLLNLIHEILEHMEVREMQQQKADVVPSFILESLGTILKCEGCEASRDVHLTTDRVYLWNRDCAVLQAVRAKLEKWCQCCAFHDLPDLDDYPDSEPGSCGGSPIRKDWWGSGDWTRGGGFSPGSSPLKHHLENLEETSLRPSSQSMLWNVSKQSGTSGTPSSRGKKQGLSSPVKPSGFEQLLSGKSSISRTLFSRRRPFPIPVACSSSRSPGAVDLKRTGSEESPQGQGRESSSDHDTSLGQPVLGGAEEGLESPSSLPPSASPVHGEGEGLVGVKCAKKGQGVVAVASVVAEDCSVATEELSGRPLFLSFVIDLLQKLPPGSQLVLHTPTSLTRFTSALVYILARSFKQVALRPVPEGHWLQMVLVCKDFVRPSPNVLRYLQSVPQPRPPQQASTGAQQSWEAVPGEAKVKVPGATGDAEDGSDMEVLSLIPPSSLFDDENFVKQMKGISEFVAAAFIQTMLDKERHRDHSRT